MRILKSLCLFGSAAAGLVAYSAQTPFLRDIPGNPESDGKRNEGNGELPSLERHIGFPVGSLGYILQQRMVKRRRKEKEGKAEELASLRLEALVERLIENAARETAENHDKSEPPSTITGHA
ncbi:hypothetical protein cyc_05434 [Cyclospora cayetanensis]|uniref:Uncharacterized protein n=1 Tax=Cyclospora cayetanensis TaxID=88456 RepID=A0A1D3CXI5_9EIME|nr:hypothetical protein cyc_05434 [Cyclospora cayetanensis]